MKYQILEKIREYSRIMIFRHIRVDGDYIGASRGLREILRLSFPEKEIFIHDEEYTASFSFLGDDDAPVSDEWISGALAIVVDTATTDRIANPDYAKCREVIKIDHHINRQPYGDLNWVESERASACELIADFYDTFRSELKINTYAATCLYLGMVTDSGRFQYSSVNGNSLRAAALMLDQGVDTQWMFGHLYNRPLSSLKYKSFVYGNIQTTPNGAAYLYISTDIIREYGVTLEAASNVVSYMEGLEGCLCWMAFIEQPDGGVRVRMRSRWMESHMLTEKYGGGGHAMASGVTLPDKSLVPQLIAEADALVKEYKETHEGWI